MKQQVCATHYDAEYAAFVDRINARFLKNCNTGLKPIFKTDADLWSIYLDSFQDADLRQYHNCHCCRNFLERFGNLATINEEGLVEPLMWNVADASEIYKPALAGMAKAIRRAKVTGVFLSSETEWGSREAGGWNHLALQPTPGMRYRKSVLTAGQAMAEKREDFKNLMFALNEYSQQHLETAVMLLKTDSLYRSEKVLGQASFLLELHKAREAARGQGKANVVWKAVATAPAGFCHPRSGMIGTLLDDLAAGKDYDDVAKAFAAKMHPLAYQRPQAAPTSGAIAAAEKLIAELGAAGSLARRFARVDEIQTLWRPAPEQKSSGGVFGHLNPKGTGVSTLNVPEQTITWERFQKEVLPTADRIEVRAPRQGPYTALVTAVNPESPPILQWDVEGARNPVSWYVWSGGSYALNFGIEGESYRDVSAITLKPSMWNGGNEHQGVGVVLVIDGAKETRMAGAALFPEIMKSEFHGIRSVIEAYSRSAQIEGLSQPHAAGLLIDKGRPINLHVRVWCSGRSFKYLLDRWH